VRRRFADLHVMIPPADLAASATWIRDLGINVLGIASHRGYGSEDLTRALAALKAEGVDAVLRLDIDPTRRARLLRRTAALRDEFQLLAGAVMSTQELRSLLRSKVDILFADPPYSRFLSLRSFRSIAESGKPFEVDFRPLITAKGRQRAHALQEFCREVRLAAEAGVTLVLSSGALDIWEMRPPREMANLLALPELDQGAITETVSSNPLRVLERCSQLGRTSP